MGRTLFKACIVLFHSSASQAAEVDGDPGLTFALECFCLLHPENLVRLALLEPGLTVRARGGLLLAGGFASVSLLTLFEEDRSTMCQELDCTLLQSGPVSGLFLSVDGECSLCCTLKNKHIFQTPDGLALRKSVTPDAHVA